MPKRIIILIQELANILLAHQEQCQGVNNNQLRLMLAGVRAWHRAAIRGATKISLYVFIL